MAKSKMTPEHPRSLIMAVVGIQLAMVLTVSGMESIATGGGRSIYRPSRRLMNLAEDGGEIEEDLGTAMLMKRSMPLGPLSFRPGKRRFLPMAGAFAHDPQNRRYELLLIDDPQLPISASDAYQIHTQPKVLSRIRVRLLPGSNEYQEEQPENGVSQDQQDQEIGLIRLGPKKASRSEKRSMAVGRTGFRPGKRSIATGRLDFRPGKRSAESGILLLL